MPKRRPDLFSGEEKGYNEQEGNVFSLEETFLRTGFIVKG
jgi:hypothetical protein